MLLNFGHQNFFKIRLSDRSVAQYSAEFPACTPSTKERIFNRASRYRTSTRSNRHFSLSGKVPCSAFKRNTSKSSFTPLSRLTILNWQIMHTSLSRKSTKLIVGGLIALILCNILFFYEGSSKNDFEFRPGLFSNVKSSAPKEPKLQAPESSKVVFRRYHDDKQNGLVVVTRSPGGVWDENDAETKQIQALIAKQETEKFKVFELEPYQLAPEIESKNTMNPVLEYSTFVSELRKFVEEVMKVVDNNKPSIESINTDGHYKSAREENRFANREGRIPVYGGHWRESYKNEPVRTLEYLEYFLRLSKEEKQALKYSHDKYNQQMKSTIPKSLLDVGRKFNFMTGDGIMYLGGGKYNQLVLLSLSILRSLGSVLPVEVVIPRKKDFDVDFCNNILPQLNGKCKVMEEYVPKSIMDRVGGFQLKNVALLVSSFKNVLYLDADNIPVKNPDILFSNEPFKSSRMVIWPDLWRRSTSPAYYEIAGISTDRSYHARNSYFQGDGRGESDNPSLISFHDTKGTIPEASSETGQLLIDKEKHFPTLILSMYYNFYGPSYYYPLFSQGAAGEGDKETFIAAAHKLNLPYYQVSEFNREFGPIGAKNKHEYFGMGQYDPIVDYAESQTPESRGAPAGEYAVDQNDDSKSNYEFHFYKSSSLMFLHANWPKFYVGEMFERNSNGRGPKDNEGNRRRLYSDYFLKETKGSDFELLVMKHIKLWACDSKIDLIDVPEYDSEGRKKICEEVNSHIDFLVAHK